MGEGECRGQPGVRSGPRNAGEQVLWTCESDERRELKRAAGDPGQQKMGPPVRFAAGGHQLF